LGSRKARLTRSTAIGGVCRRLEVKDGSGFTGSARKWNLLEIFDDWHANADEL
jgi:hypothetical protein